MGFFNRFKRKPETVSLQGSNSNYCLDTTGYLYASGLTMTSQAGLVDHSDNERHPLNPAPAEYDNGDNDIDLYNSGSSYDSGSYSSGDSF